MLTLASIQTHSPVHWASVYPAAQQEGCSGKALSFLRGADVLTDKLCLTTQQVHGKLPLPLPSHLPGAGVPRQPPPQSHAGPPKTRMLNFVTECLQLESLGR